MSPCTVLSCSVVSNSLRPPGWSPPGSSVHVDSPGKNTGVGCHVLLQDFFPTQGSNPGLPHCRLILYQLSYPGSPTGSFSSVQLLSRVWLFATPWIPAHQAPQSVAFSRQENWSGSPCPLPGNLPNPETSAWSPALAGGSFTADHIIRCILSWKLKTKAR